MAQKTEMAELTKMTAKPKNYGNVYRGAKFSAICKLRFAPLAPLLEKKDNFTSKSKNKLFEVFCSHIQSLYHQIHHKDNANIHRFLWSGSRLESLLDLAGFDGHFGKVCIPSLVTGRSARGRSVSKQTTCYMAQNEMSVKNHSYSGKPRVKLLKTSVFFSGLN